jgi:hypothetical protein
VPALHPVVSEWIDKLAQQPEKPSKYLQRALGIDERLRVIGRL